MRASVLTAIARDAMPATVRDFKAELFRTLGNAVRIHVLEVLRESETLTVTELQERVGVASLSQHLAVLRARGIVVARREGTTMHYSVVDPSVFAILDAARSLFENEVRRRAVLLESEMQYAAPSCSSHDRCLQA